MQLGLNTVIRCNDGLQRERHWTDSVAWSSFEHMYLVCAVEITFNKL